MWVGMPTVVHAKSMAGLALRSMEAAEDKTYAMLSPSASLELAAVTSLESRLIKAGVADEYRFSVFSLFVKSFSSIVDEDNVGVDELKKSDADV